MIKYNNKKYIIKQLETAKQHTTFCDFATITRGIWWYHITILQYSYDEICISIKDQARVERSYIIPIKRKKSTAWKLNKKSISCDSGTAESMIRFLVNPENHTFLNLTLENLIFSGNIKPYNY